MKETIQTLCAILIIFPLVLVSNACDDEEDTKSKTELLTTQSWGVDKVEFQNDVGTFDVSTLFACELDNTTTFNKNGTYTFQIGTDDCDGDEENLSGTWTWKNGETVLAITTSGDTSESTLIALNANTLKINGGKLPFDANGDGINDSEVSILYTFSAN